MELSISVESQEGLTWAKWKKIVAATEKLGYAGLFRSDHFPLGKSALELIVSLTYLADHTRRIHFGSLVAPFSFRNPVMLARQAAAIDNLSHGRLVLGLGAGWEPEEHKVWGYELGDVATRSARFNEGLEVIYQLFHSLEPVSYEGQYYQLHGASLLPRPERAGGPPILIGGNGVRRTLPLVARYADVWNVFHLTPETFGARAKHLDELLSNANREPATVKRTMMAMILCGRSETELKRRANFAYQNWVPGLRDQPFETLTAALSNIFSPFLHQLGASFCPMIGTPETVLEKIKAYDRAGVEELIIQWWDVDDMEGLEMYAEFILPHI